MNIRGVQKLTLVDYPGKLAAIFFTGGCNFRCPYCHNPCLVLDPESQPLVDRTEFETFLAGRRGKLDGVVFSGGEPTLQPDLGEYAALARSLGFAVKIDTNGSRPEVIEKIISAGNLDMLAVDYKAPAARCRELTGSGDPELAEKVRRTITLAIANSLELDVRTTVHRRLLSEEDLRTMAEELKTLGVKKWMLQEFRGEDILDDELRNFPTWTPEELAAIAAGLGDGFARLRE